MADTFKAFEFQSYEGIFQTWIIFVLVSTGKVSFVFSLFYGIELENHSVQGPGQLLCQYYSKS